MKITIPHLNAILEKGIKATSADNWQPWQFWVTNQGVDLYIVDEPKQAFYEADNWSRYLSAGAVIENIVIAARHYGYDLQINYFPKQQEPLCTAGLSFEAAASDTKALLFSAIDARTTNRKMYKPEQPIAGKVYDRLADIATEYGACLTWMRRDEPAFNQLAHLIGTAQQLCFGTEVAFRELAGSFRFDPASCELHGDGLDIRTLELSPLEQLALKAAASSPTMHKALNALGGGRLTAAVTEQQVRSSQALLLLWIPDRKAINYVMAGMALERLWLELASLDISLQPMTALPVFIKALDLPSVQLLSANERRTAARLKQAFLKYCQERERGWGVADYGLAFMVRVGYADPPTARSVQRPVESFIAQS